MKFPLYFVSCILNSFINQCHTVFPETVWGLHREELPPVERAGYRKTRRGVNPSQCSPSASMFCIYIPLEVRFFACLIEKNLKHVFDLEKIFINFCYLQLILFIFMICVVLTRGLWGTRNGGRTCSVTSVILHGADWTIYDTFKSWSRKKGR